MKVLRLSKTAVLLCCKIFVVTFAILVAVASADISHLFNNYWSTNHNDTNHHHHPDDIQMALNHRQRPDKPSFEIKIEKHEVIELPAQVEIIGEDRPIYGVHPLLLTENTNETVPKITLNSLPASGENLQPPQAPYKKSMKIHLPPVASEHNSRDITETTTTFPATTTNIPSKKENNTEHLSMPKSQSITYSRATNEISAENRLPETIINNMTSTPQNQYPPPLGLILASSQSMPHITYQQYQKQLLGAESMKHREMQSLSDHNDIIDQQPVAPLEYDDSFLSKDGSFSL